MEIEKLGSIQLGGSGLPIEVRILRKWTPHLRQDDTCYLLVDRSGEAIVAISHKDERKYVEPKVQTMSCYKIENYVCVPANAYVSIIRHPVNLRVGAAASIEALRDSESLPHVYFEFCPYEDLEKLIGNKQRVIDYIGLVQKKEYKEKTEGEPFLRLTLLDLSGKSIDAALWKEIITKNDRFDKHAFDNAETPAVIAITSMRVTEFHGQTQLLSTAATYMYINPSINTTESLTTWLDASH